MGWHASHERIAPSRLLSDVRHAEAVGFQAAWSSDHFSPWSERQGESGRQGSATTRRSSRGGLGTAMVAVHNLGAEPATVPMPKDCDRLADPPRHRRRGSRWFQSHG